MVRAFAADLNVLLRGNTSWDADRHQGGERRVHRQPCCAALRRWRAELSLKGALGASKRAIFFFT